VKVGTTPLLPSCTWLTDTGVSHFSSLGLGRKLVPKLPFNIMFNNFTVSMARCDL
jgi:hypothetical protein